MPRPAVDLDTRLAAVLPQSRFVRRSTLGNRPRRSFPRPFQLWDRPLPEVLLLVVAVRHFIPAPPRLCVLTAFPSESDTMSSGPQHVPGRSRADTASCAGAGRGRRDPFQAFYPLAAKLTTTGWPEDAIFRRSGPGADVHGRGLFPLPAPAENRVLLVLGPAAGKLFSVLVLDGMPALHFPDFAQCFPRWSHSESARGPFDAEGPFDPDVDRADNITGAALRAFTRYYGDPAITKDAIFDYVYGVLHAPAYGERFADDLSMTSPRVPMAPDFGAFAQAGTVLAALHLGYETSDEYPLVTVAARSGWLEPRHFRLGQRAMRFADQDRTVLLVNEHVRLEGIPPEAHDYVVNGRTPLEWFIDRCRVTKDRESGIVNDPNGWFSSPEDIVAAIRRIVHVSVEAVRIVAGLPDPFSEMSADPRADT